MPDKKDEKAIKEAEVVQEETSVEASAEAQEPQSEQPQAEQAQPQGAPEANGQYVPPAQYAPNPYAGEKKSHSYVLVIVVVVVVIFGLLPAMAFLFLGNVFKDFFNSDSGKGFFQEVINKVEPELNGEKYVVGNWNCKNFDGNVSKMDDADYSVSLVLKSDGSVQFGQYGDLENNSFKGKYVSTKEDKEHPTYTYYMLKFSDITKTENGLPAETEGLQPLEMGITRTTNGREAIASFALGNMYYCYEK